MNVKRGAVSDPFPLPHSFLFLNCFLTICFMYNDEICVIYLMQKPVTVTYSIFGASGE